MYLSFYNLKVKPFQMSTDPDFLWLGEQHKEALAILKYAIMENKGVLALTGDVGTGKTTLINALIQSLGEDTLAATIYDPSLEVLEFFNVVATAFGMGETFESKGQFIIRFREFLKDARERKQKVLLIVDEAQALGPELLEEIRLLSNLEQEHIRLLNIFFVGQNEFVDILQEYRNRALRQRITIRYHIEQLTLDETESYMRHRLKVSGTEATIFSPGALDEIFAFSGGYPRLINIIYDHALLSGYVQELDTIHAGTIRECREELLISRKSSKYQLHDQGITSPEAPMGVPPADPETHGEWGFSDQREGFTGRDTDDVPPTRDPEPVAARRMPTFIVFILLVFIGAIASYVYFQDVPETTKPQFFPITKPKPVPGPVKAAPADDKPLIPPQNSDSVKKTAPSKELPLDALPLPRLGKKLHSPSDFENTGVPPIVQKDDGKPAVEQPAPKLAQTQKVSPKNLTAEKKTSTGATTPAGSSVFSKKPVFVAPAPSFEKPPAQTADGKEAQKTARQVRQAAAEPETSSGSTDSLYNLENRLKIFLRAYCRTYEGKNLETFSGFFAPDAMEKGRPFKSWASRYRQNFSKIDSMIYNIELERYATQDETGEVRIEGIYQVRAKLSGSGKWRKGSGWIAMLLEPYKDSFRVKELNY